MHREHMFGADPDAGAQLSGIVVDLTSALRAAPRDEESLATALGRARAYVASLINDGDPRVRAQVRGVRAVLGLVAEGDEAGALEMLDGELLRSFPGRADLSEVRGLLEDL